MLTKKQKDKLLSFYKVSDISELDVTENGDIFVGKGKENSPKIYLQDHDNKNHILDISEFLNKQKNLGMLDLSKEDSKDYLEKFLKSIHKNKTKKELEVLVIEHGDRSDAATTLFQQLVIFYSNKLKSVLCGNKITEKYIQNIGNPVHSDSTFYNILKEGDNIIIKGFAFCETRKKELFIDLICGTGGTGGMLKEIYEGLSQLQGKPEWISLDSISTLNAINFYTHFGFKKKDTETKKVLASIKKSKEKTLEDWIKKNPKLSGGILYLDPPSSKKANWVYDPKAWWDSIKGGSEPRLVASGIGSFFSNAWGKTKELFGRFKPKVDGFTNQCKDILGKYGKGKVVKLVIIRQPIMGVLDTILNGITFGSFQKAKEKYGYDKLFHLQLGAYVKVGRGTTKIVLEKNETIDMSVSKEHLQTGEKEFQDVPFDKNFTFEEMVNTARTQQGDQKFFEYDAFKNNCQWFISYLLHAEDLYRPAEKGFLFQDMTGFIKDLPKWVPGFARAVTDLGGIVSNIRGKGYKDFDKLKKPVVNVGRIPGNKSVFAEKIISDFKDREREAVQRNLDRIQKRQDESNAKVLSGTGDKKYITKEENIRNRKAAERVAEENKMRGTRWKSTRVIAEEKALKEASDQLFLRQQEQEKKNKEGIQTFRGYQNRDIYKKQADEKKAKEQEAEDSQIRINTANYKKQIDQEKKDKEDRKENRRRGLSEEFTAKQEQLRKDILSYKQGRIDDIQDNEMRSRAQTERNLGFTGDNKKGLSYYQLQEETYKNALRQQAEQDATMILPSVLQMGIDQIPKFGSTINDVIDATGVKEDNDRDRIRKGIIDRGMPVRPDVLEGFEGEFPEPDWNDQLKKEGYGKKKDIKFLIRELLKVLKE